MKKYNLSTIMKRAWELVKKEGMRISSGLKKAWKEAKAISEKIAFAGRAKVAAIENGTINPNVGTDRDDESNYFTFSLWEKYGKKRIYINDYKRRSVGYIDCDGNNKLVSDYSKGTVVETANWFRSAYEF